jgi:nitrogenase-stabilizing/protective protein
MSLTEFYKITDADDYFDFFGIEYDQRLIDAKRFHLMKKFGELIEKSKELGSVEDEKLLGMYRFALLKVYKDFENGYNPSAAEIWGSLDKPSACFSCATQVGCNSNQFGESEVNFSECSSHE